jgi:hypothetical protein
LLEKILICSLDHPQKMQASRMQAQAKGTHRAPKPFSAVSPVQRSARRALVVRAQQHQQQQDVAHTLSKRTLLSAVAASAAAASLVKPG